MKAVLQVDNLSVRYRTAESEVTAVDQVSFGLAQGEILGLVGESGCGKSTLALALLGLLDEKARVHGEVVIAGKKLPLEDTGAGLSWREVRGKFLSYVPQDPLTGLNPVLRAGLQVEEAVCAHNSISAAGTRSLALSLLRKVGLPAPERAYASFPHQLSGGQRQRVLAPGHGPFPAAAGAGGG